MILAALRHGFARARGEGVLALLLAAPSLLAVPLLAVPLYGAFASGLPADRDLLEGLDGAAAIDLVNRAWPAHEEAAWVAATAGAGLWAVGGFLLHAAAARALARSGRKITATRLVATLGEGLRPLARLLAAAVVAHLVAFGFVRLIGGFLEVAGGSASTDAGADGFLLARLAVAGGFFVAVRAWCRIAVVVSARDRSGSALESFARAASLAATTPSLLAVDLAAAGAGLAAAALASIPRWVLPQGGWTTVILGLLLAQAPVVVRAFCRTAGIVATLDALGAAAGRSAAGGAAPERIFPAG